MEPSSTGTSPRDIAGHPSATSVLHDTALRKLDQQVVSNQQLDARNAQNFQVGSTVVTLAFGLLAINRTTVPETAERWLYGALVGFGLVLVFGLWASFERELTYRPDIPTTRFHADGLIGEDLKLWVALEYDQSTRLSESMLRRKSRIVGAGTFCLYAEGVALALAALVILR